MKLKITNPNYCVKSISKRALVKILDVYGKGKLLDIGCGSGEKKYLIPSDCAYTGVDHSESFHDKSSVDIISTAYNIPKDNRCFDTILCTATLEHLEEPEMALREACRVLKPRGHAIYTIPLFWHLHEEPRDFYRYTKYGLKYLFEKNGFEIVELKALSGFWVTFGQEMVYYIWRFRGGKITFAFISFVGAIIQGVVYVLDKIDKAEDFTWMYLVVERKNERLSCIDKREYW